MGLPPSCKNSISLFRVFYERNPPRDVSRSYKLERFLYPDPYAIFIPRVLDFPMHSMDRKRNFSENVGDHALKTPVHPGCERLRRAIRGNAVSFPSQIPTLLKRPTADVQRMVLLFFVRGWNSATIAQRLDVPKHRVWKNLSAWSVRAFALGYIQVIDPDAFAMCCGAGVEQGSNRNIEDIRPAGVKSLLSGDPQRWADALPPAVAPLPVSPPEESLDLIAALDVAIAHCDASRDRFWILTATLLRDLRTSAVGALEFGGMLENEARVRNGERLSHAVA